jgi:hypothetical protein
MQPAKLTLGIASFVVFGFCLPFVQPDAHAGKPWSNPDEKPGNGGRNKPPTIDGTPPTSAEIGQYYAFQPNASDRDGDVLTFSIVNKPAWAAFDTSKGFLSGFPAEADAGHTSSNITISVSDGPHTTFLAPFNITVGAAPNSPPVISGTPPAEVLAAQSYSFTPNASDPDQDVLEFSIVNRPEWASFDPSSGRLYGTPGEVHVGLYEGIRITVTDNLASASSDPFAIAVVQTTNGSVLLSWIAPVERADGSALTDLAGYRIHYGTASGQYDRQVEITGAGALSTVIENLTPGTWYFAATAFTAAGLESELSAEVQRSVQ